jgi:hypothetical protein
MGQPIFGLSSFHCYCYRWVVIKVYTPHLDKIRVNLDREVYRSLYHRFLEGRTKAITYVSKIMDSVPGDPAAFERFFFNDKLVPLLGTDGFFVVLFFGVFACVMLIFLMLLCSSVSIMHRHRRLDRLRENVSRITLHAC